MFVIGSLLFFVIRWLLFDVCYSRFVVQGLLFDVRCLMFVIRSLLFDVCCLIFFTSCLLIDACYSMFGIWCLLFDICYWTLTSQDEQILSNFSNQYYFLFTTKQEEKYIQKTMHISVRSFLNPFVWNLQFIQLWQHQ